MQTLRKVLATEGPHPTQPYITPLMLSWWEGKPIYLKSLRKYDMKATIGVKWKIMNKNQKDTADILSYVLWKTEE